MELQIVERLRKEPLYAGYGEASSLPETAADLITELVAALEKARGTIVMMREEIPVGGFAGHQTEVDIDAALARARSKG